ncbi:MAG TPA: NAD(P)-binding domain-containing protein [Nocardioides sp.]|uniref:NADPH-dependent F420 reductase n=1 Tax=Nocardioides sp. TaxID=35761 RepID=UPI002D7F7879|nr:NAD(P)-binding domain-containing protein [Nocardioides sp.]HET6652446.1 NAD(P)-binding domain-containing protein [Nocardioides sp.]
MRIAVLGTGAVGRNVAGRLAELGHDVALGTRDPEATRAREDYSDVPGTRLATFADAARDADLVVNATNGGATLDVLSRAGADNLSGKVLLDLSNPLDFSQGMPPTLLVKDTDSLAEQVQRAHPEARVVKSLNTMNNALMVHPESLADGDHTAFVAGDDDGAKAVVTGLLAELGHRDVIDLGDLVGARGVEMILPLWVRLMGTLGTAHFQFKVVR